MKTLFLLVFLSLTLFSVLQITAVDAQQYAVYIREDGSVEGTDKIVRNGDVYTLTDDISGGIKVERNSTIIDGAGYTLQGNGVEGWGVDLDTLSPNLRVLNVTVKNFRILNFGAGVRAVNNNTIVGNYIEGCIAGIDIIGGPEKNIVKNNTLVNNGNPISIAYSKGVHVITYNNIINGTTIIVWLSPEPSVIMNYWGNYNGTDANGDGIGDTLYRYINTAYAKYLDKKPLMEPAEVPILIPEFSSWISVFVALTSVLVVAFYRNALCKSKRGLSFL
jgi:parallel beta-helix repeat protein